MSPTRRWCRVLAAALVAALSTALPTSAWAQEFGRIVGTVTAEGGAPLSDAQVNIVGTRQGAVTRADGRYELRGVPAGEQRVQVLRLGYAAQTVSITVPAGGEVTVNATMVPAAVQLGGVVISASRRLEKITDAPATVSRIDATQIENTVGNSFAGALKFIQGVDYVQTGMTTAGINARGFNSSFNNRMLMMEDGRIAVLPENGLPVGTMTAIPKVDLAGIEVLVGPGAALYGPDASNGVLTLQTKDPRQYPGTTVEVAGGSRSYRDVQIRHAGVRDKIGYKVSGEYMAANDWENIIAADTAAVADGRKLTGVPDFKSQTLRGTGSLVYYQGEGRLEASVGASQTDAVGQTNVGRNQLIDWVYNTAQLKYVSPRFYANVYRTQSLSGDSYAINRFAAARPGQPPSVSDDSVRKLSDWPADGRLYAAEAQHNFDIPALMGTRVVWGGQYRADRVSSKREWLTDRETGKDLSMNQLGGYVQTETPLSSMFRVVLAARYDKHDDYDAQFSPKAALLFKPTEDQALRVTFNRAFKSPTTLQNHFNITDFIGGIGVMGNRMGFTIRDAAGAEIGSITKLVPEENTTWELGYKGVLANRLFLDATAYRSEYDHFLTPLLFINFTAAGQFASFGTGTERIENPDGLAQSVLTYRNLGRAEINGLDMGARYLINDNVSVSGTLGLIKADTIEVPETITLSAAQRRELSVLNAPTTKWTVGADAAQLLPGITPNLLGGFTIRRVSEYGFISGINAGTLGGFTSADISLGYRLPALNAQVNLAVSNLFSCATQVTTNPTNPLDVTNRDKKCGFGEKHREMINMPEIGTMVFLGVRYSR